MQQLPATFIIVGLSIVKHNASAKIRKNMHICKLSCRKNCTFVIFWVDECHCMHNSNQSSLHVAVCYHSRYSFGVPSIFLRLNSAHSRSTNCANWSVQSAQELKKTAEAVFSEPLAGLEPATHALRMRCSTNWATVASYLPFGHQQCTIWRKAGAKVQ